MKKLFLLLLMAVAFCGSAGAQLWDYSKLDKRVTFGVRAGLNFTHPHFSFAYTDLLKDGMNFHGGIAVDYNIVKSFAVETDLSYSIKRLLNEHDFVNDYSCLQLSLLGKYRYYLSENMHLQFKAGPYIAKRIGSEDFHSIYNGVGGSFPIEKTDVGIVCGLGFSFYKWYIGAQYEWGLTPIYRDDSYTPNNLYLRNLSISIGYDF